MPVNNNTAALNGLFNSRMHHIAATEIRIETRSGEVQRTICNNVGFNIRQAAYRLADRACIMSTQPPVHHHAQQEITYRRDDRAGTPPCPAYVQHPQQQNIKRLYGIERQLLVELIRVNHHVLFIRTRIQFTSVLLVAQKINSRSLQHKRVIRTRGKRRIKNSIKIALWHCYTSYRNHSNREKIGE